VQVAFNTTAPGSDLSCSSYNRDVGQLVNTSLTTDVAAGGSSVTCATTTLGTFTVISTGARAPSPAPAPAPGKQLRRRYYMQDSQNDCRQSSSLFGSGSAVALGVQIHSWIVRQDEHKRSGAFPAVQLYPMSRGFYAQSQCKLVFGNLRLYRALALLVQRTSIGDRCAGACIGMLYVGVSETANFLRRIYIHVLSRTAVL
jgi:hypothetical protein